MTSKLIAGLVGIACTLTFSASAKPYGSNKELFTSAFVPLNDTDIIGCSHAYTIVVLGSSTSFGTGASSTDSSYVNRYANYVKSKNAGSNVINLALGGYTTYQVLCPTGLVPPQFRPSPDTNRNITAALKYHPDAIIINLPTNDVANGFWLSEQKANYERAIALADAANVPVWVTTSQPRNDISDNMRDSLKAQRDWVLDAFVDKAIDFWTTVADPSGRIVTEYKYDDIHVTNAGHYIFFSRVKAKKILDTICTRLGLTPPVITNTNPPNNSTNANRNLTVTLTFNKTIASTGTGMIELRRHSNDAMIESFAGNNYNVHINGNNVSFTFSTMLSSTAKYYLLIHDNAFFDSDDISFKGIDDKNTFNFTTSVPLPLQLLSFTANTNKNGVQLNWSTGNELNTKEFIIERSADGKNFEVIGTMAAKNSGINAYQYRDAAIENGSVIYYKLKMVDRDGTSNNSNILSVAKDKIALQELQITPNPATNYIKLNTSLNVLSATIKIFDRSGIMVLTKPWKWNEDIYIGHLPAGDYYVQFFTKTQIQKGKFLKMK